MGKNKFMVVWPTNRAVTYSGASTFIHYIQVIDWFFPRAKKNENPAKYVGRVAKFMREWHGLTMREACAKFKISYISLHRIEHGKWQSIKKTHNYLRAYGLQMKLEFAPKNRKRK